MVNEYLHTSVKNFIQSYPHLYNKMCETSHNDDTITSDWHLEGSIWTHTMMVLAVLHQKLQHPEQSDTILRDGTKELLLAALLHDVGKAYTREVQHEKQKVTFYGHPGVSTFLARGLLTKIDPTLTTDQQVRVLQLINHHQILFNLTDGSSEKAVRKLVENFGTDNGYFLLMDIIQLRHADTYGRIAKQTYATKESTAIAKLEELVAQNYFNRFMSSDSDAQAPMGIILVGLPGAGKSTYVTRQPAYTPISRDAQIMQLTNGLSYNEAFQSVDQTLVDTLYEELLTNTIRQKTDLIIDKTNLTHKGRMQVITRLRKNGYKTKVVVLMPTLETLFDRNQNRQGKVIADNVISKMMKTFQMPLPNEGPVEYIFYE